jgi:YtcA family
MTKRCAIALRMAGIVAVLPTLTLAACDSIVTIANFPSWVLCMIAGAIIAALVRPLLVLSRLESHLGPLTIFYPSLIAMFAMIVWIIFFNRV